MKTKAQWIQALAMIVCCVGCTSGQKDSGQAKTQDSVPQEVMQSEEDISHDAGEKEGNYSVISLPVIPDEMYRELYESTKAPTSPPDSSFFRTGNDYILWLHEQPRSSTMPFKLTQGSRGESISLVNGSSGKVEELQAVYRCGDIEQDLLEQIREQCLESIDEVADVEFTHYDFDGDGKQELILTYSDAGSLFVGGYVFKFTGRSPNAPWEYLACVSGQFTLFVNKETGHILAPYGSQGLFDAYRFDGKTFVRIEAQPTVSEH
ncbi:MAG: hypothetical protein Q4A64_03225 [Porphyromonadaceae bacterium]|nr:hypothetical protein [Porphyromonadaceae bacterium]